MATVNSATSVELPPCVPTAAAWISPAPPDRIAANFSRERSGWISRDGGTSFEVTFAGRSARSPQDLAAWLGELRSPHTQVEFAIAPIVIVREPSVARAHFEVERRARDASGAIHLARFRQTWWLRVGAEAAPSVTRIDQRTLLPFPGTGPRIVCD